MSEGREKQGEPIIVVLARLEEKMNALISINEKTAADVLKLRDRSHEYGNTITRHEFLLNEHIIKVKDLEDNRISKVETDVRGLREDKIKVIGFSAGISTALTLLFRILFWK